MFLAFPYYPRLGFWLTMLAARIIVSDGFLIMSALAARFRDFTPKDICDTARPSGHCSHSDARAVSR